MSTEKGKWKFVEVEVDRVKNFLEQCTVYNLNPKVVIDVLDEQEKIARPFTDTIWPELENQNCELFEHYYSRLIMKEVHKNKAEMANQSNISPINFDLGASPSLLSGGLEEEMQIVKNLIEQCLVHYMSQKEVMDILYQREHIAPTYTKTILQHLIEQNQEFFKSYYFMLAAKHQTMSQLYHPNEVATMINHNYSAPATASTLEIDRCRPGILGLKLKATPVIPPALQSAPLATDNHFQAFCMYMKTNMHGC